MGGIRIRIRIQHSIEHCVLSCAMLERCVAYPTLTVVAVFNPNMNDVKKKNISNVALWVATYTSPSRANHTIICVTTYETWKRHTDVSMEHMHTCTLTCKNGNQFQLTLFQQYTHLMTRHHTCHERHNITKMTATCGVIMCQGLHSMVMIGQPQTDKHDHVATHQATCANQA